MCTMITKWCERKPYCQCVIFLMFHNEQTLTLKIDRKTLNLAFRKIFVPNFTRKERKKGYGLELLLEVHDFEYLKEKMVHPYAWESQTIEVNIPKAHFINIHGYISIQLNECNWWIIIFKFKTLNSNYFICFFFSFNSIIDIKMVVKALYFNSLWNRTMLQRN